MQITVKNLMDLIITCNNSDADSVKLLSLSEQCSKLLQLLHLIYEVSDLAQVIDLNKSILLFFFLHRILFLNIDGLKYELKCFHFPEFFCSPLPLPLIHESRKNSLYLIYVFYIASAFLSPTKTFYFEIILELQQNCKNCRKNSVHCSPSFSNNLNCLNSHSIIMRTRKLTL